MSNDDIDVIDLQTLLSDIPPNQTRYVTAIFQKTAVGGFSKITPPLEMECENAKCSEKGLLTFRVSNSEHLRNNNIISYSYTCSNCLEYTKIFFIKYEYEDEHKFIVATKIGEDPSYGPKLPRRLFDLFGNEKDNLIKGYRCEKQNLGVGAFAYYRRIIENQKTELFEEIIKITKQLEPDSHLIEELETAKAENQFSKSVSKISTALPQSLRINGHSPLTMLHSVLSENLHRESDKKCLESAHQIRIILTEFSRRMSQAINQNKELLDAVHKFIADKSRE